MGSWPLGIMAALPLLATGSAYPGPLDFNCTSPPLSVVYGAPLGAIHCGTKVLKTNAGLAQAPTVTFPAARAGAGYTLMMIDAGGSAGPQEVYPVRHWLVVNIPGAELRRGNITGGLVGEKFHSPGPPSGSHYHRYAQFVFEQPSPIVDFSKGDDMNMTIPFHTPVRVPIYSEGVLAAPLKALTHARTCGGGGQIISWNYSIFIDQFKLGQKKASNYILCEAPGGLTV